MALYTLADLHLACAVDKPMDIFGGDEHRKGPVRRRGGLGRAGRAMVLLSVELEMDPPGISR